MKDLRFYQPILRLVERAFSPYSRNVRRLLFLLIVPVNVAHAGRKILFLGIGALGILAGVCRYVFQEWDMTLIERAAVSGMALFGAVAALAAIWLWATFRFTHHFKLDYAHVSEKLLPFFGLLGLFVFYAVTTAMPALYAVIILFAALALVYYRAGFIRHMNYPGREFVYWNLHEIPSSDELFFPARSPTALKKLKVTLAGETRNAVVCRAGAGFIAGPVKIRSGDRLVFSTGLPEVAFAGTSVFEIYVSTDSGPEERYFSHGMEPAARAADRAWKEFQVDLSRLEGKTVELRFNTLPKAAAPAEAYWEFPRLVTSERPSNPRPPLPETENIIIIVMDGVRADLFKRVASAAKRPLNILRFFSRDSIRAEQAVAQNDWTNPSFASIFSGTYASRHQHFVSRPLKYCRRLSVEMEWLPEILRRQGYITYAFSGYGEINPMYGFARGFDSFYNGENLQAFDPGETASVYGLRFLKENEGRKKFLFLHDFATHRPFVTRRPYRISSNPNFGAAFNTELYESFTRTPYEKLTPEDKKAIVDSYCSAIAQADIDLSVIFDYLIATGQTDNSLVILTSDHGYQLFDRGSFSPKVTSLYEEMIRVPFFVRAPKQLLNDNSQGQTDALVEANTDIFPTVLDAIGLSGKFPSQGRSVLKLGRDEPAPREHTIAELFDTKSDTYMLAVRGKRYKLISTYKFDASRLFTFKTAQRASRKLFDLSADPLERDDISGKNRDVLLKYCDAEQDFMDKNGRA